MPRISRAVAVGYPHYATQRGNYRQIVFEEDRDYLLYLQWLKEYAKKYFLKVWAYCLMSNHVHFVCVPHENDSLSKTFNALNMRYSQYFNQKKEIKGHLWQGRFYSCILDERHAYEAIRYVENSPVRAKIVKRADDYLWSSARSHVYKEANPILEDECYLIKNTDDWLAYLMEKDDEALVNNIREKMKTGRPCGDEPFVRRIEELLKRKLMPLPRGRPPKPK
jgi:putative transposase